MFGMVPSFLFLVGASGAGSPLVMLFMLGLMAFFFFFLPIMITRGGNGDERKGKDVGRGGLRNSTTGSEHEKRELYEEKLKSEEWKRRREEILERDGHRCQWCGRRGRLQVHHKRYDMTPDGKMVEPWDYPDSCFITLCDSCHRKWHAKYRVRTFYRKYGEHYR